MEAVSLGGRPTTGSEDLEARRARARTVAGMTPIPFYFSTSKTLTGPGDTRLPSPAMERTEELTPSLLYVAGLSETALDLERTARYLDTAAAYFAFAEYLAERDGREPVPYSVALECARIAERAHRELDAALDRVPGLLDTVVGARDFGPDSGPVTP